MLFFTIVDHARNQYAMMRTMHAYVGEPVWEREYVTIVSFAVVTDGLFRGRR
jgi:hypothetical protein